MATEHEIREAERTRLEGLVAEHGTESEQASLLFSGVTRSGITLARLAEAHAEGSVIRLSPEPELLAKLTRRIERRVRLKLPQVACAADPPTPHGACSCLERALDESEGGKREVLRAAARFHWSPPPRPAPVRPAQVPQEALAEPQEATESVEDLSPPPPPTPTPEPRVRVVHRTRKWFDEAERPRFSDMKF
jgi:hypothetical protein